MNAKIHLFINQEYLQQDNSRHMSVSANFLVVNGVNGTMFLKVTYHNPSNLSVLFDLVAFHKEVYTVTASPSAECADLSVHDEFNQKLTTSQKELVFYITSMDIPTWIGVNTYL